MIESSPAVLRIFQELGARYLILTHLDNVPWADAATDRPERHGLTEFGKNIIRELNRIGVFADISHVSPDAMLDTLHVTRSPVIFSHSSSVKPTRFSSFCTLPRSEGRVSQRGSETGSAFAAEPAP